MRIVAVDDEFMALDNLRLALEDMNRDDEMSFFQHADEMLEYLKSHPVDLVFVDINMGDVNGLDVAADIREINPDCLVVFLTGYNQFTKEALRKHAFDYILKPINDPELAVVIADAERALGMGESALTVKTFGNFEFIYNGEPVHFQRSQAKELLAYLVDRRGTSATTRELGSILWPNSEFTRSKQSQLQIVVGSLLETLREVGAEDILIRQRGSMAIDPSKFECDYYQLLEGDEKARSQFIGEYMANYEWAEVTTAQLAQRFIW